MQFGDELAVEETAITISNRLGVPIAVLTLICIGLSIVGRLEDVGPLVQGPLMVAVALGGGPLVFDLLLKAWRRDFGSDFLAAISIVTAVALGEWLAAAFVVLMLSGGAALERYAVRTASAVLEALAKRVPSIAHRRTGSHPSQAVTEDIPSQAVEVGDVLEIFPHEICPVDGVVLSGSSTMDESFLTGEPYQIDKTPGCEVISGAVNGQGVLAVQATRKAVDSRYARIVAVMSHSRQLRPRMRRIGDQLGGWYSPLAVAIALGAWIATGEPTRFLAVLVVATPCPLLIAIPVAIIGAISLAARRGIIIKDPVVLERVSQCRTVVFDKTGTLTFGSPVLTEVAIQGKWSEREILSLAATVERYSKHPLAAPILAAARKQAVPILEAERMEEKPGQGVSALIAGKRIRLTSRGWLLRERGLSLPPSSGGLEAVIMVDDQVAAILRFRDEPRGDSAPFVGHLSRRHRIERVLLVSGDREEEVKRLAAQVGILEYVAEASPEQKVEIVRRENARAPTIFIGDGINDAPALGVASVGISFGSRSEITGEAAGAVLLEPSLSAADELLHIGAHMRAMAMQSALGGMTLSAVGMCGAAFGLLSPVAGAIVQELIDLLAVLNALRAGRVPKVLVDIQ